MLWDPYLRLHFAIFISIVPHFCRIPLEAAFTEGNIPPAVYNVVKDEEYRGEIKVGLTFTPEVIVLPSHIHVESWN
jgi:hypothetical protein